MSTTIGGCLSTISYQVLVGRTGSGGFTAEISSPDGGFSFTLRSYEFNTQRIERGLRRRNMISATDHQFGRLAKAILDDIETAKRAERNIEIFKSVGRYTIAGAALGVFTLLLRPLNLLPKRFSFILTGILGGAAAWVLENN